MLERLAERGPCIPTPEDWNEALGHWCEHGRGHRLWLFSNGSGLQGLGPLLKPLAVRHRIVWFRPHRASRRREDWPDPKFSPKVECQFWDIRLDPVAKLGAWLKGGGA